MDGIEATRLVTAVDDPPRVLVLTTFDLDEVVYDALRAGASGFLLKDAPEERLTTAIRVVADGGSLFAPSVTRRLIEEFAKRDRRAAGVPGRPHRARGRGAAARRARDEQHRDRRGAVHHREHREDPRGPGADEARAARPGPGRGARLRVGTGPARRSVRRLLAWTSSGTPSGRPALLNAEITDVDALRAHLADRDWLVDAVHRPRLHAAAQVPARAAAGLRGLGGRRRRGRRSTGSTS